MRAGAAFRLIVSRGGHGPGWLSRGQRTDRVEVVGIEDGEVLLTWEGSPAGARRVARALRGDLAAMSAEEFARAWEQ